MNFIITGLIIIGVSVGGFLGLQALQDNGVGGFADPFLSLQLATSPVADRILSTDGTNNSWIVNAGGAGGGTGAFFELISATVGAPTTTVGIIVLASSTFIGDLAVENPTGTTTFNSGLTIETSGFVYDFSTNRVGIGIATPDGALHVHTASAGSVVPSTNGDDLVVENDDNVGISILNPNNKIGRIFFGSPEDPTGAKVQWSNSTDVFMLGSTKTGAVTVITSGNDTEAIRIDSSQNVGIGDTTPT